MSTVFVKSFSSVPNPILMGCCEKKVPPPLELVQERSDPVREPSVYATEEGEKILELQTEIATLKDMLKKRDIELETVRHEHIENLGKLTKLYQEQSNQMRERADFVITQLEQENIQLQAEKKVAELEHSDPVREPIPQVSEDIKKMPHIPSQRTMERTTKKIIPAKPAPKNINGSLTRKNQPITVGSKVSLRNIKN